MMHRSLSFALFLVVANVFAAENLRLLGKQQPFYEQLQREAYAALDERMAKYEKLKTADDVRAYQAELRQFFLKQIGGLPQQKHPLNAVTTRTIQADGYRIENVIFDSRPKHRITANFYLPEGAGPFPAVVVASGHSRTAKTADYNQRFALMMVRCGMAALAFDPIGQGERSQILNADGKNQHGGTTTEHFLVGVGSILVGRNTAAYEIWDSMRAVDYLVSRPEVDAQRIGMTGCSGGGTQTSYAMALDERIRCAAPSCYLTTFRHLIEAIGPQDSEQNIFGQLRRGMDHPDYVIMRAPRPTLISATGGDYFSIEGAWENFRQGKRIYGRLGFPERVDLVESDGRHGVPAQNLATIGHWMRRWLAGTDEPEPPVAIQHRPAEELHCTTSGQVLTLPGERSVFDLNAERARELAAARKRLWARSSPKEMRAKLAKKLSLSGLSLPKKPGSQLVGRIQREGYAIEKRMLKTQSGFPLPVLVFRPDEPNGDATLYLHADGKEAAAAPGGAIEAIVKTGATVVAADLRGQGETAKGARSKLHGHWKTYYIAYLLGGSLIAPRTEDTLLLARFAMSLQRGGIGSVDMAAVGEAGIIALHAAALEPDRFRSVKLRDTPKDWTSIVGRPAPSVGLDYTIHGALELYDLPDLATLAGKGKVKRR